MYLKYFISISLLFIYILLTEQTDGDDFYTILGIARNADTKDIRKAYKKLALTLHPDKNKENKTTHELFLKVTKAYETLKDPESRRKYDLFGESQPSNNRQQYTWRQEFHDYSYFTTRFGFFDDSNNIIDFTEDEFDNSIKENGAIFIFFYNPYCDKCFKLQQTWMNVADDLDGVIQIGAVNCKESISLCSKLGYVHVPRFVLFNKNKEFPVDMSHDNYYKTTEELVAFVIERIEAPLIHLTEIVWHQSQRDQWVISLCVDKSKELLKLSIILENIIQVGYVTDPKLCTEIYYDYNKAPLIFWQTRKIGTVKSFAVQPIHGETSRQLADQALQIIVPDPVEIEWNNFQAIQTGLLLDQNEPAWLFCFYVGQITQYSLLLKRLQSMLPNIKIGLVNCARNNELCRENRINHYPSWGVVKFGGSVELHYGRDTLRDLVIFVKDSIRASNLKYINREQFYSIIQSNEAWLTVWSVSWCGPCRRFLPSVRRSAGKFKHINYGVIDCVEYRDLCARNTVRSYPTVRFYKDHKMYHFFGPFTTDGLNIFVQEMLSPKILYINNNNIHKLEDKDSDELFVVLYYSPLCGSCHTLHSLWRHLALELSLYSNIKTVEVDCIQMDSVCRKQKITFYPTVHIYPAGNPGLSLFDIYRGDHTIDGILKSLRHFIPSNIKHASRNEIETLIRSFSVSLILFYDTIDTEMIKISNEFFKIVENDSLLPTKITFRLYNCKTAMSVCKNENLMKLPQIVFFDYGTRHLINSVLHLDIINDIKTHIYLPTHDEL